VGPQKNFRPDLYWYRQPNKNTKAAEQTNNTTQTVALGNITTDTLKAKETQRNFALYRRYMTHCRPG